MGTIFAPAYAHLTIGYYEIKVYSVIRQGHALASQYLGNSWFRFLDDSQILLTANLIKSDHLLLVLNKISYYIQFTQWRKVKQDKNLEVVQKYV